jgi:hypothetical protein
MSPAPSGGGVLQADWSTGSELPLAAMTCGDSSAWARNVGPSGAKLLKVEGPSQESLAWVPM